MSAKKILYIVVHPNIANSVANKAIADTVDATGLVKRHDLYAAYPDGKIDVAREQALLLWADLIVFQFPFYWYSAPPLLKEWQDQVLKYGFAFTLDGTPSQLRGREVLVSTTSGGSKEFYQSEGFNRFSYEELLRPLEQTVHACQMTWLGVRVADGTMFKTPEALAKDIAAHAEDLAGFVAAYGR